MFKLIMSTTLGCFLSVLLTGCTTYETAKTAISVQGSKAADSTLEASEWQMCQAATVGSVKRRFKTAEEIAAYNAICGDVLPVAPKSE